MLLVFAYVCLAWIFFRATSFDNALAILRQIALLETDHANLVPLVTVALAAGFATHFFADGSFRWLRERFVATAGVRRRALVLAGVALVLRELAHTEDRPVHLLPVLTSALVVAFGFAGHRHEADRGTASRVVVPSGCFA